MKASTWIATFALAAAAFKTSCCAAFAHIPDTRHTTENNSSLADLQQFPSLEVPALATPKKPRGLVPKLLASSNVLLLAAVLSVAAFVFLTLQCSRSIRSSVKTSGRRRLAEADLLSACVGAGDTSNEDAGEKLQDRLTLNVQEQTALSDDEEDMVKKAKEIVSECMEDASKYKHEVSWLSQEVQIHQSLLSQAEPGSDKEVILTTQLEEKEEERKIANEKQREAEQRLQGWHNSMTVEVRSLLILANSFSSRSSLAPGAADALALAELITESGPPQSLFLTREQEEQVLRYFLERKYQISKHISVMNQAAMLGEPLPTFPQDVKDASHAVFEAKTLAARLALVGLINEAQLLDKDAAALGIALDKAKNKHPDAGGTDTATETQPPGDDAGPGAHPGFPPPAQKETDESEEGDSEGAPAAAAGAEQATGAAATLLKAAQSLKDWRAKASTSLRDALNDDLDGLGDAEMLLLEGLSLVQATTREAVHLGPVVPERIKKLFRKEARLCLDLLRSTANAMSNDWLATVDLRRDLLSHAMQGVKSAAESLPQGVLVDASDVLVQRLEGLRGSVDAGHHFARDLNKIVKGLMPFSEVTKKMQELERTLERAETFLLQQLEKIGRMWKEKALEIKAAAQQGGPDAARAKEYLKNLKGDLHTIVLKLQQLSGSGSRTSASASAASG